MRNDGRTRKSGRRGCGSFQGGANLTVTSAQIRNDGVSLLVVFSEAPVHLDTGNEGFALTGLSGGATTIDTPEVGANSATFDIGRIVVQGETGAVLSYTPGHVGTASGAPLLAFTNLAVTNNSLIPA
jgi:hypothetical protein